MTATMRFFLSRRLIRSSSGILPVPLLSLRMAAWMPPGNSTPAPLSMPPVIMASANSISTSCTEPAGERVSTMVWLPPLRLSPGEIGGKVGMGRLRRRDGDETEAKRQGYAFPFPLQRREEAACTCMTNATLTQLITPHHTRTAYRHGLAPASPALLRLLFLEGRPRLPRHVRGQTGTSHDIQCINHKARMVNGGLIARTKNAGPPLPLQGVSPLGGQITT